MCQHISRTTWLLFQPYSELSHSPASAKVVRLKIGCENNHFATEAASSSVRLLQILVFGAFIVRVPGAAQVWLSDRRLVWPFNPTRWREFLKLPDFEEGSGLQATRSENRRSAHPAAKANTASSIAAWEGETNSGQCKTGKPGYCKGNNDKPDYSYQIGTQSEKGKT
jgi:hypothetical protein